MESGDWIRGPKFRKMKVWDFLSHNWDIILPVCELRVELRDDFWSGATLLGSSVYSSVTARVVDVWHTGHHTDTSRSSAYFQEAVRSTLSNNQAQLRMLPQLMNNVVPRRVNVCMNKNNSNTFLKKNNPRIKEKEHELFFWKDNFFAAILPGGHCCCRRVCRWMSWIFTWQMTLFILQADLQF